MPPGSNFTKIPEVRKHWQATMRKYTVPGIYTKLSTYETKVTLKVHTASFFLGGKKCMWSWATKLHRHQHVLFTMTTCIHTYKHTCNTCIYALYIAITMKVYKNKEDAFLHARMHAFIHASVVQTCMNHAHKHTYINAYMVTHACVLTYISCESVHQYIRIHTYIHTYHLSIHLSIHAPTHPPTHPCM